VFVLDTSSFADWFSGDSHVDFDPCFFLPPPFVERFFFFYDFFLGFFFLKALEVLEGREGLGNILFGLTPSFSTSVI